MNIDTIYVMKNIYRAGEANFFSRFLNNLIGQNQRIALQTFKGKIIREN